MYHHVAHGLPNFHILLFWTAQSICLNPPLFWVLSLIKLSNLILPCHKPKLLYSQQMRTDIHSIQKDHPTAQRNSTFRQIHKKSNSYIYKKTWTYMPITHLYQIISKKPRHYLSIEPSISSLHIVIWKNSTQQLSGTIEQYRAYYIIYKWRTKVLN